MKTGQPLEYNLTNVFLEKSYTKCGGKTIPRPFFKKSILSIFLDQYSKSLYILFLLFAKLRTIESDWNKTANPLLLPHIKLKKKKKKYTYWPIFTIAIHILTNILRDKDNQAMKTGQPLEYNLTNVFLEKSYTKCGGKTIPRPFFKKSILSIFLDQYSKSLYILFLLFAKLRTIESDWNKTANPLLLPHIKLFFF